jgi:putative endonuclease
MTQFAGMRRFYVYILASHSRRLYVGVTNDLKRRVFEHRAGTHGFSAKYRIRRLVHFEETANPGAAIAREKQIKGWLRRKKIALIEASNAHWVDLAEGWYD